MQDNQLAREVHIFDSIDALLEYSEIKENKIYFVNQNEITITYKSTKKNCNLARLNAMIFPFTIRGLTITVNSDGWMVFNGTAQSGGNLTSTIFEEEYIRKNVIGKKVTINVERDYDSTINTGKLFNFGFNNYKTGNKDALTFTIDEKVFESNKEGNRKIYMGQNPGTYIDYKIRIQMQIGETFTGYVQPDTIIANNIVDFQTEEYYITRVFDNSNTIDIREFGGKRVEDNFGNLFDNKVAFNKYQELVNTDVTKIYTLYIPTGAWPTSPMCFTTSRIHISGDYGIFGKSCLIPLSETKQDYIIKLGGNEIITGNDSVSKLIRECHIRNLTFTCGYRRGVNDVTKVLPHINHAALYIDGVTYSSFDNLSFSYVYGGMLAIRSSWELYFGTMNFRGKYGFDSPAIRFAKSSSMTGIVPNISSSEFKSLMFEGISGDCMLAEPGSGFTNNEFGIINVEIDVALSDADKLIYKRIDYGSDVTVDILDTYNQMAVFKGMSRGCTVSNICVTNNNPCAMYKNSESGEMYLYRAIFMTHGMDVSSYDRQFGMSVGTLSLRLGGGHHCIYYTRGHSTFGQLSIGTLIFNDQLLPENIFDIKKGLAPSVGAINIGNGYQTEAIDGYNLAYKVAYQNVVFDSDSLGLLKYMAYPNSNGALTKSFKTTYSSADDYCIKAVIKVNIGEQFEVVLQGKPIAEAISKNYITSSKGQGTGNLMVLTFALNSVPSEYFFKVNTNKNINVLLDGFYFSKI